MSSLWHKPVVEPAEVVGLPVLLEVEDLVKLEDNRGTPLARRVARHAWASEPESGAPVPAAAPFEHVRTRAPPDAMDGVEEKAEQQAEPCHGTK